MAGGWTGRRAALSDAFYLIEKNVNIADDAQPGWHSFVYHRIWGIAEMNKKLWKAPVNWLLHTLHLVNVEYIFSLEYSKLNTVESQAQLRAQQFSNDSNPFSCCCLKIKD